jgi:hypothetical protein
MEVYAELTPTNPEDAPSGYTPDRGTSALAELKPRLADVVPRHTRTIRLADAAIAGAVLHTLATGELAPRLATLASECPQARLDDLKVSTWALWHLDLAQTTGAPQRPSASRVPAALWDAVVRQRREAMLLLEFAMRDDEAVQAELARVRSGHGHIDHMRDLLRLSALVESRAALLAQRVPQDYTPAMAPQLVSMADDLREALGLPAGAIDKDTTAARVWAFFFDAFTEVRAALAYLLRNDPDRLNTLPTLVARRSPTRTVATPNPTPTSDTPAP